MSVSCAWNRLFRVAGFLSGGLGLFKFSLDWGNLLVGLFSWERFGLDKAVLVRGVDYVE